MAPLRQQTAVGLSHTVGQRVVHDPASVDEKDQVLTIGALQAGCAHIALDADRGLGRDVGDLGLPRRGVGAGDVVVVLRPLAGQPRATDAVLGQQQVVNRGHQAAAEAAGGHASVDHLAAPVGGVEEGERDLDLLGVGLVDQGQTRSDALQIEVPGPLAGLGVAIAERAVRNQRLTGRVVDEHAHGNSLPGWWA